MYLNLNNSSIMKRAVPLAPPLEQSLPPPTGQITRKVLHRRTELRIYPNGQVYLGKSEEWIENQKYIPKEKKPKVMGKKEIEVQDKEEY